MNPRRAIPILILAVAAFASARILSARPSPQAKASRSDSDVNAIGHRDVGKGVNLFSIDKEKELGKHLAMEVERSSRLIDDPIVIAYVDRIAQNIAKNSDAQFPITIKVIDSDMLNAFTLSGGFQYVNSGLILQTEGEAELAGVLANGIAHTALRSSTREVTKAELMQLASIPAMIFIPYSMASFTTYQHLDLAIPLTFLKFSRDADRAADFFGLQYMYKAGYDPNSYVTLLERIWADERRRPGATPKVFSTHAPTQDRIANAQKEIATILPHRDDAIVSSLEFQEVKERLRAWNLQKVLNPRQDDRKPILRKLTDNSGVDPPRLIPD
jgi:beta-barrel assembly-enhancing protease